MKYTFVKLNLESNQGPGICSPLHYHYAIQPIPYDTLCKTRTCNLRFRRPVLYPVELRVLHGRIDVMYLLVGYRTRTYTPFGTGT